MAMQLSCDCGNQFLVDAADHGKQVRCPACRVAIQVPGDGPIVFECAECGNSMKARASYAGRQTNCPKCQASATIPGKETPRSPLLKKPPVGRTLGIAAVLLLLLGGILLAVLFVRKGEKGEIDDLSLVPADAQVLVCIKVGALWETPAVRKAILDARRDDIGKQLEAGTGLKPEEIERATIVVTNAGKGEGWIVVRTKRPYAAEALRKRFRDPNDPLVYVDPDPNAPPAFAPVGPRVFVFGMDAGVRRALALIGGPVAKGPLTPVVETCRKADHVVFGYNPGPDAGAGEVLVLGIDLGASSDMDFLLGTLNIREEVELEVRARTASKEKADDLRGATDGRRATLKGFLFLLQLQGGEKGQLASQAGKLLKKVKLGTDDKDVVATMKADADLVLPLLLGATRLP